MKRIAALFMLLALLGAVPAGAGEGRVTKARGTTLTIDRGAQDGLTVGTEVMVVRSSGQAVIHPVTGENLGSPDIQIGVGQVTKTSGRAASVRLRDTPLLAVRPGDVVRFTTPEEGMVLEQERTTLEQEKAAKERHEIRGEISRLAKDIKGIQGNIHTLEDMVKRLDGIDRTVRGQLGRIGGEVASLRTDVKSLKETVALLNQVPVTGHSERGAALVEADRVVDSLAQVGWLKANLQLLGLVDKESLDARLEELLRQRGTAPTPTPAAEPATHAEAPAPAPAETEHAQVEAPPPPTETEHAPAIPGEAPAEAEPGKPFYQEPWFYPALGGVGLLAVAFVLIKLLRSRKGSGEDEEREGDEEEDEDDEDIDAEEDDIVVEESSN
jgi:hypothetical protein